MQWMQRAEVAVVSKEEKNAQFKYEMWHRHVLNRIYARCVSENTKWPAAERACDTK